MTISVHEEMNPLKRSTMEDGHLVLKPSTWNCYDPNMWFLGVYDGHGGRDIVNFVDLHRNIVIELNHGRSCIPSDEQTQTRKKRKLSTKENYCSENIDNASIPERLERGFLITDIESYQENIMASGSTALVCLVTKEKESDESDNENIVIYAAGVGDTRCVLSCLPQADKNVSKSSTLVQRLSTDHRASDPKEQQRVDSSGGFVFKNRVLGILSVSRSLGDHKLKQFVIGRPDVTVTKLSQDQIQTKTLNHQGKRTSQTRTRTRTITSDISQHTKEDEAFLILACDGLWDVFTDEEAVNVVKKYMQFDFHSGSFARSSSASATTKSLSYNEKKQNISQYLVREALKRGSSDNVTVVVAWLADFFP
eukprot:CAMPEP_0178962960 /NCGR_PEP_ID=MMETSP0789-20121207/14708_1 /TAXON_ID=3005 /ORGANISM="Rhizosolenia setigera, Strain CCMP 1694" /LENGTH=364 /DNA_ID=CAMNT_0020647275 /DNA_START=92 /DNA_END=1186 /DNA_ORIENTATION=-